MSLWTLPEEVFQERHYRYVLDGEAFDWLVLAERLLTEVDGLVPEEEKNRLLLSGELSNTTSAEEFKQLNHSVDIVPESMSIMTFKTQKEAGKFAAEMIDKGYHIIEIKDDYRKS